MDGNLKRMSRLQWWDGHASAEKNFRLNLNSSVFVRHGPEGAVNEGFQTMELPVVAGKKGTERVISSLMETAIKLIMIIKAKVEKQKNDPLRQVGLRKTGQMNHLVVI